MIEQHPPASADSVFPAHPDPADPITCAASSLLMLSIDPEQVDPGNLAAMETALRNHTIRIAREDFGGLELMLTVQTQLLHHLFSRSIASVGNGGDANEMRLHGRIALQSHKNCRMTVRELALLKKARAADAPLSL